MALPKVPYDDVLLPRGDEHFKSVYRCQRTYRRRWGEIL
jgi:hypothetical protein